MQKWAILDPYIETPSRQSIERLRERHKHGVAFDVFVPSKGELPPADSNYCGFIGFGSYAHVTEEAEWMIDLAQFLIQQLKRNIPVLGICFVHQLLAKEFGAKVVDINHQKTSLKGLRTVQTEKSFCGVPPGELELFYSHSQRVVGLPPELESIGRSLFENEVIAHKNLPFLGLQSHPEGADEFCEQELVGVSRKDITTNLFYGDKILDHFIRNGSQ